MPERTAAQQSLSTNALSDESTRVPGPDIQMRRGNVTLSAAVDGNVHISHPAVPLRFTGERMTSAVSGQIEFEHFHRYFFARDLCVGIDVLDVACGEGYGSAILSGVAKTVLGVEVDAETVDHARGNYSAPNLSFLQADAASLPLTDASMDAVVSFETLEHLKDQRRFLAEVKRILRPNGFLVISMPDRLVYSAAGTDPNPCHILELSPSEFVEVLSGHFKSLAVLSQRPVLGSIISGEPRGKAFRSYERRSEDVVEATNGLARAHYLIAVAGNSALPGTGSSVYLDRAGVHATVERARVVAGAEARLSELALELERVRGEACARAQAVTDLRDRLAEEAQHHRAVCLRVEELATEAATARDEADRVRRSLSEAQDRFTQVAEELGKAARDRESAYLRAKTCEEEISRIRGGGERVQQTLSETQQKFNQLAEEFRQGWRERESARLRADELEEEASNARHEADRLRSAVAKMQERCDKLSEELRAESSELESAILRGDRCVQEAVDARNEADHARTALSEHAERFARGAAAAQEEIDTLRSMLGEVQGQVDAKASECNVAHQLAGRLGEERDTAIAVAESHQNRIAQLKKQVAYQESARLALEERVAQGSHQRWQARKRGAFARVLGLLFDESEMRQAQLVVESPPSPRLSLPVVPSNEIGDLFQRIPDADNRQSVSATRARDSSTSERPDLQKAFQTLYRDIAIYFPPVVDPDVSVIIPVYKGVVELKDCLRSLSASVATEPSFEVIVVDDCPSEPVLWALPNSGGLIKIENRENLGFLLTCNRGASFARGRILCFLNSDTIVLPGWLANLVDALESRADAGLAGSLLVNVDGSIQEAGWSILANGWGHPIGRGSGTLDGRFTYRRTVDCVTGASFAVSQETFQSLGGLDPLYVPAFYEEFDFAFRAQERGLKVIYEPKSRVIHLGSASYGAEQRDHLSAMNHDKFVQRFAERLKKHAWNAADEFALRLGSKVGRVILVIDLNVPQPMRHAGDLTMHKYVTLLADAGWHVVFGAVDGVAEGPASDALEQRGIEMIRAPQGIEGWLKENGEKIKYVWLSRPEVADKYLEIVRQHSDARVAYYPHDLHHIRMLREAELHDDARLRAAATCMQQLELSVLKGVDVAMPPSEEEAATIRRISPETTAVVLAPYFFEENDICVRREEQFSGLKDVVFVGGFPHTPNIDAALYIVKEVMPIIWRELPETRLYLIGYAPPPEVVALAGPRVVVTGQVPELRPFLEKARLMLAALRYGSGVKGKVVDALRLGVPVVTTPIGAEGIGIVPGRDAIVAESASALAEACISLLGDAGRCCELSHAGTELVRAKFSRVAARRKIDEIFPVRTCAVCGSAKGMSSGGEGNFRESFVCGGCFALARTEALARIVVSRMARRGETSLAEVGREQYESKVHEFGFVGAIAEILRGHSWFSMSEYFEGTPLGQAGFRGIRCEDLGRLTFPDQSFDITISQDVLEHVPDPVAAFGEIARVLRPGGVHIFTVPQNPGLPWSVARARLTDEGPQHLLPAEYHGDPIKAGGRWCIRTSARTWPK